MGDYIFPGEIKDNNLCNISGTNRVSWRSRLTVGGWLASKLNLGVTFFLVLVLILTFWLWFAPVYVLNLPSLATLICETTVLKVLKALMTSNLTIGFFPWVNFRRVLVFTFFLLLFSSSTVFLVLKFACQGQHLKKLVAGLGASNIIKAGMSFRFVPLFYPVTKEKRTIFCLFFYFKFIKHSSVFYFLFF